MTTTERPDERPFRQELWNAARYYLGGRTGIALTAAAVLGAGAYFNWSWLVALGLAPIIFAALPCAVMGAFGLCMNGRSRASGGSETSPTDPNAEATDAQSLHNASSSTNPTTKEDVKHSRKGCC